jgi:hypothetical protein
MIDLIANFNGDVDPTPTWAAPYMASSISHLMKGVRSQRIKLNKSGTL